MPVQGTMRGTGGEISRVDLTLKLELYIYIYILSLELGGKFVFFPEFLLCLL